MHAPDIDKVVTGSQIHGDAFVQCGDIPVNGKGRATFFKDHAGRDRQAFGRDFLFNDTGDVAPRKNDTEPVFRQQTILPAAVHFNPPPLDEANIAFRGEILHRPRVGAPQGIIAEIIVRIGIVRKIAQFLPEKASFRTGDRRHAPGNGVMHTLAIEAIVRRTGVKIITVFGFGYAYPIDTRFGGARVAIIFTDNHRNNELTGGLANIVRRRQFREVRGVRVGNSIVAGKRCARVEHGPCNTGTAEFAEGGRRTQGSQIHRRRIRANGKACRAGHVRTDLYRQACEGTAFSADA